MLHSTELHSKKLSKKKEFHSKKLASLDSELEQRGARRFKHFPYQLSFLFLFLSLWKITPNLISQQANRTQCPAYWLRGLERKEENVGSCVRLG